MDNLHVAAHFATTDGKTGDSLTEIDQAINAGYDLLNVIENIETNLRKAKTWSYIDLFSDGGLITSIFKHSRLHDASAGLNSLRYHLNRFNSELKDVQILDSVNEIKMSGTVEICDWLLDGLIFDTYTLSRIYKSSKELENLKGKVKEILNDLERIRNY